MAPLTETRPIRLPRRRRTRAVGRYSLFVGIMKFLLPTLAAGLIVLVALWSQFNLGETRFRIGVVEVEPGTYDSLSMTNPRYEGIDRQGRPFSITADAATQADREAEAVRLAHPKADVTLDDGTWVAVTAEEGLYRRAQERLELGGQVNLFHDRGFELHGSDVRVDLERRTVESGAPVQGHGPYGELDAEGFRVMDSGDRILLLGRSSVTIHPGQWAADR